MKQILKPITITVLNNEIILDAVCLSCTDMDVYNWEQDTYIIRKDDCERCNGKHYTLTKIGQAVIDLLKRHA